jgi:hypothetical protein
MRRIVLAALAALAVAAPADARWLVVSTSHASDQFSYQTLTARSEQAIAQLANQMGQQVDYIRSTDVDSAWKMQGLRRGVWWFRGAALDTSRYDLVIHNGYYANFLYTGTRYRPDSLQSIALYPKVPQLFIGLGATQSPFIVNSAENNFDSTGVTAGINYVADFDSTKNFYVCGKPWLTWKSQGAFPMYTRSAGGGDPRGWRPLIGAVSSSPISGARRASHFDDPWNGSAPPTLPDTVSCWAINMWAAGTNRPLNGDAKPLIFTSLQQYPIIASTSFPQLMIALAYADSVSGGVVIRNSTALPVKMAIHIDDGWRRGTYPDKGGTGGMDPADTTTFIASIDSLASLNTYAGPVPVTVGVEIDSLMLANSAGVLALNQYQNREAAWWARAGTQISFTPHSHAGLSGTTARTATSMIPNDLWATSGTSNYVSWPCGGSVRAINCGWLRAYAILDSVWGASRIDHIGMPPTDDWSPAGMNGQAAGNLDSLWLGLSMGRVMGVRTNPSCGGCNVSANHGSGGYYVGRYDYVVRYSAPTGFPDSTRNRTGSVIPTATYGGSGSRDLYGILGRADEAFNGRLRGAYKFLTPSASSATYDTRTYFLTGHCSELGSDKGGTATLPLFGQIKYLACWMAAANAISQRQLFAIVRPDRLTRP